MCIVVKLGMTQILGQQPIVGEVPQPVEWLPDNSLRLVDQTLLPSRLDYVYCRSLDTLAEAICALRVRGAPTIGVAAAYGLLIAANLSAARNIPSLLADLESAAALLRGTRPTAVNLPWALDTVLAAARRAATSSSLQDVKEAVHDQAQRIDRENRQANERMGEYGSQLLRDGMNILTHCNAGPLAAGGIGTALGVIYTAHRQGKHLRIWVDETRPVLQGARLTTWELGRWGVPYTLIADSAAASLMRAGCVDAIITGADRIAANGDVANKIGTYGLATLAHAHNTPFYVAAPTSTFDLNIPNGESIKIEERPAHEITHHGGKRLTPQDAMVYNPAFDVTPACLINAIITEVGLIYPPLEPRSKVTVKGSVVNRRQ